MPRKRKVAELPEDKARGQYQAGVGLIYQSALFHPLWMETWCIWEANSLCPPYLWAVVDRTGGI